MSSSPSSASPFAAGHPPAAPNMDPAEIAKFEAMSSEWWDEHSDFAALHHINPLRLKWIEDRAGGLAGKKILDVGCGGGILAESMARRGAEVLGIDMGEAPLEAARAHAHQQGIDNLTYRQVPVEQLAAELPGQFDAVTCMEMLEHVPDPASIVRACAQLVKPGGEVFFSTVNRNPKSYLFAILGAEYILNLVPRGTHDFKKFIRPSELAGAIRTSGLQLKDMAGLHYNPLTRHYWIAPGVDVNYMVCAHRPE